MFDIVCLFVCSAIQIHSSKPIWTKVGMKHPYGQGQIKIRLLMYSVEVRSAESSRKKWKCSYHDNHWIDFNQVGVWMHTP